MTQFKEAVQIAKDGGFKVTNKHWRIAGYKILRGDNDNTIRIFSTPELIDIDPIADHFINLGWTEVTDRFNYTRSKGIVVLELLEVK